MPSHIKILLFFFRIQTTKNKVAQEKPIDEALDMELRNYLATQHGKPQSNGASSASRSTVSTGNCSEAMIILSLCLVSTVTVSSLVFLKNISYLSAQAVHFASWCIRLVSTIVRKEVLSCSCDRSYVSYHTTPYITPHHTISYCWSLSPSISLSLSLSLSYDGFSSLPVGYVPPEKKAAKPRTPKAQSNISATKPPASKQQQQQQQQQPSGIYQCLSIYYTNVPSKLLKKRES